MHASCVMLVASISKVPEIMQIICIATQSLAKIMWLVASVWQFCPVVERDVFKPGQAGFCFKLDFVL